ncbi:unnamed protein product [Penicillium olsonii]|uniref:Epoxide hydrolase N-terminal domain-containing protein n=1 Tax=Penicillium olsonii TaxID=99116 RepID=A0A9W4IK21_PENOL|nr:unnamed protein product [Penicillium olsonii]CAG8301292.1 unnamed protein product [Penicillium olsonii]
MPSTFGIPPKNISADLEPFKLHVPEYELFRFKELLRLSEIGPETWWNVQNDPQVGISRKWLAETKETWLYHFDWRKHEDQINKFPSFKTVVEDNEAGPIDIHFTALFSAKEDAIPMIFLHGFPSSFMEYLPMIELLAEKYTPENLPYHIIVPSLPDYGLSSRSALNMEMTVATSARIMNKLMLSLGFGNGYVAQGGDLGSMIARVMSVNHEECKALHVNMLVLNPGENPTSEASPDELEILQRSGAWMKTGLAYALVHGTRPSTVGLAISSSPLALLAWVGEKLLEWVDPREPLSIDTVLAMISFYWFTRTFPRSLYHAELVRNISQGKPHPISKQKPLGYSLFPHDLAVLPKAWAEELYPNLILFKAHSAVSNIL